MGSENPETTREGLIGITDVETVAIEGTAQGAQAAEKALADALAKVPALAA